MVGWAGDNGVCIIQVKICLPGRNMPPEEKYACLEKVQKFFSSSSKFNLKCEMGLSEKNMPALWTPACMKIYGLLSNL